MGSWYNPNTIAGTTQNYAIYCTQIAVRVFYIECDGKYKKIFCCRKSLKINSLNTDF